MFDQGFQTPRNNKTFGLRPRAFITFSVFGTPDETLALVFDILRQWVGLDCHMQVDLTGFRVKELSERRKLRGLRTRSGEAADRTTKS